MIKMNIFIDQTVNDKQSIAPVEKQRRKKTNIEIRKSFENFSFCILLTHPEID